MQVLHNPKLKRDYKILSLNIEKNSVNGACIWNSNKYFFKSARKVEIFSEIQGYKLYTAFTYCGKICDAFPLKDDYWCLIYQYRSKLQKENKSCFGDLLNDYLLNVNNLSIVIFNYLKSFNCVGNIKNNIQFKKFFLGRVHLIDQAKKEFINEFSLIKYLNQIKESLLNYTLSKIGVLTHGDPNELNFGSDGSSLDFEEVGYNDPMLEFIILFWDLYLGGAYLFPKYQPTKYTNHNFAYRNKICLNKNNSFTLKITKQRIATINYALAFFKKLYNYYDSNNSSVQIMDLFAFRMLTVIPILKLDEEDKQVLKKLVKFCKEYDSKKCTWDEYLTFLIDKTTIQLENPR